MSKVKSIQPVLILAGGTGGHIFPALAVAEELQTRAVPVHWLGGAKGLESTLVPAAGIGFTALPGRGIRGTGWRRKLLGPPRLVFAVYAALRLIRRLHPSAAIGFGGYASGAGGLAAWLARCPLLIHEQNAIPGATNRVLARFAKRILTGLPGAFDNNATLTGNPVRREFAQLAPPAERLRGRQGALRLLVVGGSQGAQALNAVVPAALARSTYRFEVRHLCGVAHVEETQAAYREVDIAADVQAFESDMASMCVWADLVVARAGALSLAEFAAAGLPSILVPYPWAVDDHQSANARVYEAVGAACLIPQSELDSARLSAELDALAEAGREHLLSMAECAYRLARPDAAVSVACATLEVAQASV
ncbi:MAG: undecaprenyldiphospho-muramoylpentapeptide beta-N-acetylglucosaminyltransferase [Gammaproteobacteria bacterium]